MVCYSVNGTEYLTKGIYIRKSAAESQVKFNNRYSSKIVWFIKEIELC